MAQTIQANEHNFSSSHKRQRPQNYLMEERSKLEAMVSMHIQNNGINMGSDLRILAQSRIIDKLIVDEMLLDDMKTKYNNR